MLPGELKPILSALVLPPASFLLLALLGVLLLLRRHVRLGATLALLALASLWLLSCHGVAMQLARWILPPLQPVRAEQLAQVQAIVVLGGGVFATAPEYGGTAQPSGASLARLRYGAMLARRAGKPLAYAGGVGWSSSGTDMASEAEVATRVVQEFGATLRWSEGRSRDTEENALELRRVLAPAGITRVALVTHAWHMGRAAHEFRRAGFVVVPAPTGFPAAYTRPLLAWMPSADGLALSREVLREGLGTAVARLRP